MTDIEEAIVSYECLERWQGGLSYEDRRELEALRESARHEAAEKKIRRKR
jgi:hypothetical protein